MRGGLIGKYLKDVSFPKVSIMGIIVNITCVIGVGFFAVNIFGVIKLGIERYNLIQNEVDKLNALKLQEDQLRADLDWFSSLDFIEAQSRDYLNLANEGDSILVVPEGVFSNVSNESTTENDDSEVSPDIRNWLNLIL